jgi:hypothetical protein
MASPKPQHRGVRSTHSSRKRGPGVRTAGFTGTTSAKCRKVLWPFSRVGLQRAPSTH